ncbi:Fe(3+)-hydroxamate ABC transporter permease FhuB [Paenibacillus ginsengarvi]|uniref:Fe(3+)-hydroxamate ABC transporter permease FhuB n=1 Tax=Paenibacillus ginsengarvi TaxID=400777 RepID=A0A3B0CK97_9BACL|nr:Fe(3+)-hydroxamate ABC transporter permease FhuB [Paenibacillus ginsengarvi]RKN84954.1 Fe(3+)-hydroxamate ABC transporter permease FhuB [Paenibacillus ginsengarvi]
MSARTVPAANAGSGSAGWKIILVFGGGLLALIALLFASLTQGEANITARTVVDALLSPTGSLEHQTVLSIRMPRAVIGLLAGAALAVSGVLLQTVTRNPLASAGTFGVNSGAYFVVVAATVFAPALASSSPLLLALIGGCGGAVMAYLMAGGPRGTPVRMALAGMIITMVLSSFTSALQLLYENETNGLFMWGSGSLVQNDWKGVFHVWPWLAAGAVVLSLFIRTLDMLELGDETAKSLGQRVGTARMCALAIAVLLASVTVSVVGPIGFIGLIAPHLVRLIGLRRHRLLLPASALWGAVVLIGADTVARLFRSTLGELPAGAVTALIGAPWLIWLAVRGTKEQRSVEASSSMSVGFRARKLPYPLMLAVLAALVAVATVAGLAAGALNIPAKDVLAVLFGGGQDMYRNIILEMRLPRLAVAMLAGAGLAVSGVMLQGAVRNPLADPSVIGVTSGAGAGALLLLVIWPSAPGALLPATAFAGALIAAAAVYALSWRKALHPTVLTLVGIAVSAIGSAAIHFLVIQSKMAAAPALAWLAGSTYGRGWKELSLLAAAIVIFVPMAWLLGRRIDLLAFGDPVSLGLGLKLQRTRLIAAGVGVALAAVAVSCIGTVGFIGLLAPHAARMLVGQNQRRAVVLAALIGALLLLLADVVGRVAIVPKEIPAGLVVAVIGTPYLLALMYRSFSKT